MACLYCGKDIGAFRLLRAEEFCSSAHQKQYAERLGKALHSLAAPEPAPAREADFIYQFPAKDGEYRHHSSTDYQLRCDFAIRTSRPWSLCIEPVARSTFRPEALAIQPAGCNLRHAQFSNLALFPKALRLPAFLKPADDISPTASAAPVLLSEQPPPQATTQFGANLTPLPAAVHVPHMTLVADHSGLGNFAGAPRQPAASPVSAVPSHAGWIKGPEAEPAERIVLALVNVEPAATVLSLRLRDLVIAAATQSELPYEGWLPGPVAEPAERLVFAAAMQVPLACSVPVQLPGNRARIAAAAPCAEPACPGLPAEPAERPVYPAAAHSLIAPAAVIHFRSPDIAAAEPDELAPEMEFAVPPRLVESWFPGLAAESVERTVQAVSVLASISCALATRLPRLAIAPAPHAALPACSTIPGLSAEPAERLVVSSGTIESIAPTVVALRLPGLGRLAEGPETFIPTAFIWAAPLPAEPATIRVEAFWDSQPAEFMAPHATVLGSALTLPAAAARPQIPGHADGAPPCPVESLPARTRLEPAALGGAPALAMPAMPSFAAPAQPAAAAAVDAPVAEATESIPLLPPFGLRPEIVPAAAATPPLHFRHTPELQTAAFDPLAPAAFQPPAPAVRAQRAAVTPISSLRARISGQPERPVPAIPTPGLVPLEYFCQRIAARPLARLDWRAPRLRPTGPLPFGMVLAQERTEEIGPAKPEIRPKGQIAEILKHPEAVALRANNRKLSKFAKIAACLAVGASLWLGARVVNFGKPAIPEPEVAAAQPAERSAPGPVPALPRSGGPIAAVRRVIASRAAIEATDNFHAGMEAWGAAPKSWVTGWSRHPDGYVSPGELALFGPSLSYKNYSLEFYGQIENKSLDWVVRARDKENYYAMKFQVVDPGLRPVIAMVHYPVVGGKKGHRVETPLSVMVHNNRPYHITVDVKGNHYTASIEGEKVNSWTDNTLGAGGVGFFSEAGEKARIYWMRVSKNQDWIGRVCAFIAGSPDDSGSRTTAELWAPEIPPGKPEPVQPDPQRAEALLGAAFIDSFSGPFRAGNSNLRRVS